MPDHKTNRLAGYATAAQIAAEAVPDPSVITPSATEVPQLYLRYTTDTKLLKVWTGAAYVDYDLTTLSDVELLAIAGLTSAADRLPYFTGLGTASLATFTSVARTLVAQTTQALMRTTGLGLGTSSTVDTGTSGTKVALTDGANTWSAAQTDSALATFSLGANMTPAATPATNAVGYLGAPQNTQNGTYTTVMSDAGKHIYHTSGSAHTWTIDSNANVAYPIGTVIAFLNESGGGVVTLAITSDTLRWGSSTGSRSLAANATATAVKVTSTAWRLTGDGIT